MCGLSMGLLEAGRAGNRRSLGSKRPQPYHFAPCVADSLRTLCCGFTSHLVLRIHKGEREAQNANKVGKNQVLLLARCIGLSDKYKQVTSGPGRSFVQFGPVRKFEQGWAQVPPAPWARPARAPRATRTPRHNRNSRTPGPWRGTIRAVLSNPKPSWVLTKV